MGKEQVTTAVGEADSTRRDRISLVVPETLSVHSERA
jgi:hypothetical protein